MENRLEITVTALKCIECDACPHVLFEKRYKELYPHSRASLTVEKFKKCLSHVPEGTRIDWSGFSEPFFNAHTIEMMKYTADKGYKQSLYTTLMGLDMDKFNELRDIEFDPFVVHIPDAEGHTPIAITNTYKRFLTYVTLSHKVTAYSVHGAIPDEIKDIIDKYVPVITYLHSRAGNIDSDLVDKTYTGGAVKCSYTGYDLNHNVLLPNGMLALCCMDFGLEHILGSLSSNTWEKLHSGERIEKVRKLMQSKEDCMCNYCERGSGIE